jgi:hypothetical protein
MCFCKWKIILLTQHGSIPFIYNMANDQKLGSNDQNFSFGGSLS